VSAPVLYLRENGIAPFGWKMQLAELDYIVSSPAAAKAMADNYVGLPF
jgi:p-hydroxybenzoate 3-monooxygenase